MAGQPITWRQLAAPDFSASMRGMEQARAAFRDAFAGLNQMATDQEAIQKRVRDEAQLGTLLSAQELLAGATSPEQLETIRGQVQGFRERLDPAQRTQLLGAEDKRLGEIRNLISADRVAADSDFAWNNRGVLNQAQELFANGKVAEASALLAPYRDQIANYGALYTQGMTAARQNAQEVRATAAEDHLRQTRPLDLQSKRLSITGQQVGNETAYQSLQKNIYEQEQGKTPTPADLARFDEMERKGTAQLNALDDRIRNAAVQETLLERTKASFQWDKKTAERLAPEIRKLLSTPEFKDLRLEEALSLIQSSDEKGSLLSRWINGDNSLIAKARERLKSPEHAAGQVALSDQIQSATQDFQARMRAERDAVSGRTGRAYQPLYPEFARLSGSEPASSEDYRRRLESGFNPDAKNPNSTASGIDQVTDATWTTMVGRVKPAWAKDMTPQQIKDARFNPEYSRQITNALEADNAAALRRNNLPVTNQSLYAMHHFGEPAGLRFMKASDSTPMTSILSQRQLDDNAYLKKLTKAEAIAEWDRRAGVNRNTTGAPAGSAVAQGRTVTGAPRPDIPAPSIVQDPSPSDGPLIPPATQAPAPAPSPTPAASKVEKALNGRSEALMREQVQLERDEQAAGVREGFSKEVQSYLDATKDAAKDRNRSLVKELGKDVAWLGKNLGGAAADVAALPIRGLVNAYNRAASMSDVITGGDTQITAPWATDVGYWQRQTSGLDSKDPELLKRRRAQLDARLKAETEGKKKR